VAPVVATCALLALANGLWERRHNPQHATLAYLVFAALVFLAMAIAP